MHTFQVDITLPPEIDHLKLDIERFIMEMVAKLFYHRGKGHWEDITVDQAYDMMSEEMIELIDVIENGSHQDVHREAADVANYALILSSVLRRDQLELNLDDK